jgi:amino acid transporter
VPSRYKYHLYVDGWKSDYFELIRKREFNLRFDVFIHANKEASLEELYKKFSVSGSRSTNHLYKVFGTLIAGILSASASLIYFLFSNASLEIKWQVTLIFLACATLVVYITAVAFWILKQEIASKIRRDKKISQWIRERLSRI